MPAFCEVLVNRPIVRHRVVPDADYPQERDGLETNYLAVTFSYAVPKDLQDKIAPGQLVEVPFRNGSLQAVVVSVSDVPPDYADVRSLNAILETQPAVSEIQLQLAYWLSEHYLAPLNDCTWPFLPPGIRRSPQTIAEPVPGRTLPPDIDPRAAALYAYLLRKGATPTEELDDAPLKTLSEVQAVRIRQRLSPPQVGPLVDRTVELIAAPEEVTATLPTLGHASKQADVLLFLQSLDDPLPRLDEVLAGVGCGSSVLRRLEERGWVKIIPRKVILDTPLSGDSLEQAFEQLVNAPAQRETLRQLSIFHTPVEASRIDATTSILAALETKGYVRRWTEPDLVSLTLDPEDVLPVVIELRGAARHAAVLDMLSREESRVWVGWVYVQTDANLDTLRQLAQSGLVSLDEVRRWRDPLSSRSFVLESPPRLTPEQTRVWQTISRVAFDPDQPAVRKAFLLHGVTGSGKTEIYLRAVAEALKRGQGVIVLVPEIALAAQTVQRVAARFPGKVAVWHSDLSLGERFDTWQRVRDGTLPIVVGARSALFSPVRNLGLIVVDEEHEPAYKQARSPRYHARDMALQLGRLSGAAVILGSATPDVTTFRRAERGELDHLSLPNRVLAHSRHLARQVVNLPTATPPGRPSDDVYTLPLPRVDIVDMAAELKAGNRTIFSRSLQEAISHTLAADQQVILFLNRRGAATFVMCRDCGHVMTCPRCHMPLTYHANDEALICHHCNRREPSPDRCPACNSNRIRYFGLGTERVEADVNSTFPAARTLRWDLDTARLKGSHEAFLEQFAAGRANVLVGTQMIAKGLDLPRVTLVGVISADTALYMPDFRAAERTFQLLMQVAGRAGRSPLGGRVIVQTYHPELPLIRAAAAHDYAGFYSSELAARKDGRYPPFKRLARLIFAGSGAERAEREAKRMAQVIRTHVRRRGEPGVDVVGPAPCFYSRLRGLYRWHVIVRADRPEALLRPIPLPLGWRVDVDPTDLL